MRRLALALLVVLATAGCSRPQTEVQQLPTGPLTKDEYVHAFDVSAAGLAPKYGVQAKQDRREHLVALQRLLRAWADRLETLQPPPAAARAQLRYVAGIRSFATDLDRARAALARGDAKGAEALLSSGRIVSAQTRANLVAARRAFHALGYDLQDLDSAPVKTP